jgi:hypothetical protein
MRYLQKMFLVRTSQSNLFEKAQVFDRTTKKPIFKSFKVKAPRSLQGTTVGEEVSKHHPIKISFFKNVCLFLSV